MSEKTSAASHTPGPWVALEPPNRLPEVWRFGTAECVTDRVFNGNCRLIAAAPELLAALKTVLGSLEGFLEIADAEDLRDDDAIAVSLAQAAIAKAEGRPGAILDEVV